MNAHGTNSYKRSFLSPVKIVRDRRKKKKRIKEKNGGKKDKPSVGRLPGDQPDDDVMSVAPTNYYFIPHIGSLCVSRPAVAYIFDRCLLTEFRYLQSCIYVFIALYTVDCLKDVDLFCISFSSLSHPRLILCLQISFLSFFLQMLKIALILFLSILMFEPNNAFRHFAPQKLLVK